MTSRQLSSAGSTRVPLLHPVPDRPVLVISEFADHEAVEDVRRACSRWGWTHRLVTDSSQVSWASSVLLPSAVVVIDIGRTWTEDIVMAARAAVPDLPIVVLGSLGPTRALSVLKRGADTIVPPDLDSEEMLGRIYAIIRRSRVVATPTTRYLVAGRYRLDIWAGDLAVDGHAVGLTTTEYRLLSYLMSNAERTLNASQILDHVWQSNARSGANALRITIGRLRNKMSPDGQNLQVIKTIRGRGYKFVPPVVEVPDEDRVTLTPKEQNVYLEKVTDLAERLSGCADWTGMCGVLVRHIVESGIADGAAIHEIIDDRLILRAHLGFSDAWLSRVRDGLPADEGYASVRAIRADQPILIRSETPDFRLSRAVLKDEQRGLFLFLPSHGEGLRDMSLGLARWSDRPFDLTTLTYLQTCLAVFAACTRHAV